MLEVLLNWYRRRFSDPNAVTLFWLLIGSFTIIYFYGDILAPVLAALVIAYLLEWFVQRLMQLGLSRRVASTGVVLLFIGLMLLIGFGILPTLFRQGVTLVKEIPNMLTHATIYLKKLPQMYPQLVDASLVDSLSGVIQDRLLTNSGILVSLSFTSLMNLAVILVYMVLVPLLVFFMLKDKDSLLTMMKRFLPYNRELLNRVWLEMNTQITNYIRGKVIHIMVVSLANYIVFAVMGVNYALLLGISVGLSVLIPYIGAVAVTIPVVIVALFQWGVSSEFAYLMLAYAIVQTLDGNILTPLLFSEAMNLHPLAIILAVLIFGGIWGFWGVFFAIPLATLVKAVVNSWPGSSRNEVSVGNY